MSSSRPRAPFKSRSAKDIVSYFEACLASTTTCEDRVNAFNDMLIYLSDMDADCNPKLTLATSVENPTGLTPEAMNEKMDILLQLLVNELSKGFSDDFYVGLLEVFENVVLKLHQPHYVQFLVFYASSTSRQRSDDLLSLLLNIVHDPQSDPIARREAIAFIGSFVCRATFVGGTHSARTAKYLVSFIHSLDIAKSSGDRLLCVLALQTVCYIMCWECDRWRDQADSSEFDWLYRSKLGLVAFLIKTRTDGILRLVSFDILSQLGSLVGRLSVQIKELVSEALSTYKNLLPPLWKPLVESKLLKPHFPFETFSNLPRTTSVFKPLIREWVDHTPAEDASDGSVIATTPLTDESGCDDQKEQFVEKDDIWSFHPLKAALGGASPSMGPILDKDVLMPSPLMDPSETADIDIHIDIGENLVLSRILSSKTFAAAP